MSETVSTSDASSLFVEMLRSEVPAQAPRRVKTGLRRLSSKPKARRHDFADYHDGYVSPALQSGSLLPRSLRPQLAVNNQGSGLDRKILGLKAKWWLLIVLGVVLVGGASAFAVWWFIIRPRRAAAEKARQDEANQAAAAAAAALTAATAALEAAKKSEPQETRDGRQAQDNDRPKITQQRASPESEEETTSDGTESESETSDSEEEEHALAGVPDLLREGIEEMNRRQLQRGHVEKEQVSVDPTVVVVTRPRRQGQRGRRRASSRAVPPPPSPQPSD